MEVAVEGAPDMAHDVDDEFSQLWQRHLSVLRDDFSATSVQALPSLPSGSWSFDTEDRERDAAQVWDETMDSVVDALDELTLQSPNTTDTHSPETPWFPDRYGYTETVLSSPLYSSWRPLGSPRTPGLPQLRIEDYSEAPYPGPKGKGVETTHKSNQKTWQGSPMPFLLQKQLLSDCHPTLNTPFNASAITAATETATATARTTIHTPFTATQKPPPTQVHVLVLTWATPQPPGSPHALSIIDSGVETLRSTLKRRGYRVQCRSIPTDYPTAAVETLLDRFLERSSVDGLLVVYYRGYGGLDREGRMLFSSGPEPDASAFFWDDVRDPVMQVPGDVLLVFDCAALPGMPAEMRVEAGMVSSASTKQLLGVCVPSGYRCWDDREDGLTQSLCRTLERTGDGPVLSVQRLCSLMREDLRGTELASRVFVSQLGGGQLLDIYLPRLVVSPRIIWRSASPLEM